jgi:hypothetical protein
LGPPLFLCLRFGAGLRAGPFFFVAASPHQLLVGRRALPATRTGQHRGSCTSAARFDRHNRHAILAALPIPPVTHRASSLWGRNVTFWGSNNWQLCQYQLKSASAGLDTLRVSRFYQKLSTPKMLLFARVAVSHQLYVGRRASRAYLITRSSKLKTRVEAKCYQIAGNICYIQSRLLPRNPLKLNKCWQCCQCYLSGSMHFDLCVRPCARQMHGPPKIKKPKRKPYTLKKVTLDT